MKKFLAITVLFICQNVFCQAYHFDREVLYKETSKAYTGETTVTIFFNSTNESYYFVSRSWGNDITAYLVDNTTNSIHNFFTDTSKDSNQFTYLDSTNFEHNNCEIDCSKNTIEEKKNAGTYSMITCNEYTTKKKKRIYSQIEVTVKPTNFTCLKPIIKVLQHHFKFCDELKTTTNNLPVAAKYKKGEIIYSEQKLEKTSNIELDFLVKKESIKYKTTN